MRVKVTVDLGEVELVINTDGMQIEKIWCGSDDFWGKTAEDLVIEAVGLAKIMREADAAQFELMLEGREPNYRDMD